MDAEIKNVVVGKVLSMVRHENSDHMWVCMVDVRRRRAGADRHRRTERRTRAISSPWPCTTAYLPGGVHITKGKLRGVAVLTVCCCSLRRAGPHTSTTVPDAYDDGIWILKDEGCTSGQDINEVIGNDDTMRGV